MNDKSNIQRLILGSGRSGTTWVLDCLAQANQLRPIFEPLHEAESDLGMRYAFDVLVPGDRTAPLERYFRDLSNGLIHTRWIDYRARTDLLFPNPSRLATANGLKRLVRNWREYWRDRSTLRALVRRHGTLIKCIRANLMAGWFARDLGFLTVLIVRHPCAVVQSQYRIGYIWDPAPVIDRYRMNSRLHEITEGRYLSLINSRLTRLQALTLNWIIENQWPVRRALADGYHVYSYEHLLTDPIVSWAALCAALNLQEVPGVNYLQKPSQQTSAKTAGLGAAAGTHEAPWRKFFTSQQLAEIQSVLDATECDLYEISADLPLQIQAPQHSRPSARNDINAQ